MKNSKIELRREEAENQTLLDSRGEVEEEFVEMERELQSKINDVEKTVSNENNVVTKVMRKSYVRYLPIHACTLDLMRV